jgi:hypothetical protein
MILRGGMDLVGKAEGRGNNVVLLVIKRFRRCVRIGGFFFPVLVLFCGSIARTSGFCKWEGGAVDSHTVFALHLTVISVFPVSLAILHFKVFNWESGSYKR